MPKKPNTGHAPINRKASPAPKLTRLTSAINTRKPVRFSDRCGVSSAENNAGSGRRSKSLPAVMAYQYTRKMAKSIRSQRAGKPRVQISAKKSVKKPKPQPAPARQREGLSKQKPGKSNAGIKKLKGPTRTPKPWTAAEVHEAFSR